MFKFRSTIILILEILLIVVAFSCGRITTSSPLNGSLQVKNGFYVLHLWGSPEEMGRAHGTLLKAQISDFIHKYLLNGYLENSGKPWTTLVSLAKNYEEKMSEDFKAEIRGIAEGAGVSYEEILVIQVLVDLVGVGSTSFVAKGGATSGEAVIHGTNIEWLDYNNILHSSLVIIYYEPASGNKFVSLSYAGGAGVLIGMNEKYIANSITLVTSVVEPQGMATTVNLREMIQYSSDLSEVETNLTAHDRTRGYTVPVSCGSPESILVMELSPTHFAKRETGTFEALISTNHFISEEMKPYQVGTSEAGSIRRYDTLENLIMQNYGSITESLAKSFMSDRSEPHGDYINNYGVIYSAVLLPKDLTFWVAKGPVKSVADYVSFSLKK